MSAAQQTRRDEFNLDQHRFCLRPVDSVKSGLKTNKQSPHERHPRFLACVRACAGVGDDEEAEEESEVDFPSSSNTV